MSPAALARLVASREAAGEPRKQAIAAVAAQHRIPKRTVFDAVVAGKGPSSDGPTRRVTERPVE
jgi:16S rRNA (cytidine1402-2'-O)-methyltransferase